MDNSDLIDYLDITRGKYTLFESTEVRNPKMVEHLEDVMGRYEIKPVYCLSSLCKTEVVSLGECKYFVFDRQPDLYINALKSVELFGEKADKIEYDRIMLSAVAFIAANFMHYAGNSVGSRVLLDRYCSWEIHGTPCSKLHAIPCSIIDEYARMQFVTFHEWGHTRVDSSPDLKKAAYTLIDEIYTDLVSERIRRAKVLGNQSAVRYYETTYWQLLEEGNKDECAVDYLSMLHMINSIEEEPDNGIFVGGLVNYVQESIKLIYHYHIIRTIEHCVELASSSNDYVEYRSERTLQRLAITRQLLSRVLIDERGIDEARSCYDRFTQYYSFLSGSISSICEDIFLSVLEVSDSAKASKEDVVYCEAIFDWR